MRMRDAKRERALDLILSQAPLPVPSEGLVRRIVVSSVTLPQNPLTQPPRRTAIADAIHVALPRLLRSPLGGALAASLVLGLLGPWQRDLPDHADPSNPAATLAEAGAAAPSQGAWDRESPVAGTSSGEGSQLAYADRTATTRAGHLGSAPQVAHASVANHDDRGDAPAPAIDAVPVHPATSATIDYKLAAKASDDPTVYGPVLDQANESVHTPIFSSGAVPVTGRAFSPSH